MVGRFTIAADTSRRTGGFTIIELMVSLAIAAVLITVGLPAFNGFVAQQRLTTYTNDFVAGIAYARSEAAKLGGVVSVQALTTDNNNEWGGGYCIVAGKLYIDPQPLPKIALAIAAGVVVEPGARFGHEFVVRADQHVHEGNGSTERSETVVHRIDRPATRCGGDGGKQRRRRDAKPGFLAFCIGSGGIYSRR